MTQHISRRAVTKGAAWAVPAVAVAASAPSLAASPVCSPTSSAKIDTEFTKALAAAQAVKSPLFEIYFYQGMDMSDGGAQTVYVNVKNISGTPQVIGYSDRLAFTLKSIANDTVNPNNSQKVGRGTTGFSTATGRFRMNGGAWLNGGATTTQAQPGVRDKTWVQHKDAVEQTMDWEFYGITLGTSGLGARRDAYFAFGDGYEGPASTPFYNLQYMTVTPTVNPARVLLPDFASLGLEAACQAYYDKKAAEFDSLTADAPASKFVASGPLSGSYQLKVGETIDSRVTGNTVGGIQWGTNYNGIF